MGTKQDPAPLHAECNHGQVKHTPTPWIYDPTNVGKAFEILVGITSTPDYPDSLCSVKTVCHVPVEDEANAAFIVRAVNAHEELLAACKYLLLAHENNAIIDRNGNTVPPNPDAILMAKQAIAKAEGK